MTDSVKDQFNVPPAVVPDDPLFTWQLRAAAAEVKLQAIRHIIGVGSVAETRTDSAAAVQGHHLPVPLELLQRVIYTFTTLQDILAGEVCRVCGSGGRHAPLCPVVRIREEMSAVLASHGIAV